MVNFSQEAEQQYEKVMCSKEDMGTPAKVEVLELLLLMILLGLITMAVSW
jgi:hypothetical protein